MCCVCPPVGWFYLKYHLKLKNLIFNSQTRVTTRLDWQQSVLKQQKNPQGYLLAWLLRKSMAFLPTKSTFLMPLNDQSSPLTWSGKILAATSRLHLWLCSPCRTPPTAITIALAETSHVTPQYAITCVHIFLFYPLCCSRVLPHVMTLTRTLGQTDWGGRPQKGSFFDSGLLGSRQKRLAALQSQTGVRPNITWLLSVQVVFGVVVKGIAYPGQGFHGKLKNRLS